MNKLKQTIKKFGNLMSIFFLYILISMYISSSYMVNTTNLDEGTYLAVGMMFAKGDMIYIDISENKPPLFHILNALIYFLSGSDVKMARFIVILLAAGTGMVIYFITKNFCSNRYAILGGTIFAVYSSLPIFDSLYMMTEPFSIFTASIGIFLFLKCFSSTDWGKHALLSGVFLGSAILIRQTAIVLFGLVILWSIIIEKYYKNVSTYRVVWIIVGASIPFLVISIFLAYNNAFGSFVSWMFQPHIQGFIATTTTPQQKMTWFMDTLRITFPLWILLGIGLVKNDNHLLTLIAMWPIILTLLIIYTYLPGYHHYYYETLPILAILGAKSLENIVGWTRREYNNIKLSKYDSKKIAILRLASVILLLICIGVLFGMALQENISLSRMYISSNDMLIINKTTTYLNEATLQDRIFVFETKWPKIGPYIYYLSEKRPPTGNLFFFPPDISDERTSTVIDKLDSEKISYVVLIGSRPPFRNAQKIYDNILSKYKPVEKIADNFTPYLWLSDQPVWIYERVYENQSSIGIQNFEDTNKKTFVFSPANNVVEINYSTTYVKEGNGSLMIEYLFQNGSNDNWFTVFFFNESRDWSNDYPVLSLWVYGDDSKNILHVDINDKNKNTGRYSSRLDFKGWRQILIPIRHEIFIQPPWSKSAVDFSQINIISASVDEKQSSYGKIHIDDIRLYFIEEKIEK